MAKIGDKSLHGWFGHKNGGGGGWVDCKASRKGKLVPCGRKKAGPGTKRAYPVCRPTLAACSASKSKKKSSTRIKW